MMSPACQLTLGQIFTCVMEELSISVRDRSNSFLAVGNGDGSL